MVKRILWFARSGDWNRQAASRIMERFAGQLTADGLPEGIEPKEGWMRETPISVELSSEQFPGSKPVWIWEQP